MRKLVKRVVICFLICLAVWGIALVKERDTLNRELIRFHVVANSDSAYDQQIKLRVKDAVLANMEEDLQRVCDKENAEIYIRENLPKIQRLVDNVLKEYGYDCEAVVSYCREAFPIREYDTFSLPSGVYDTLRITLGSGEGHNWWCVSFPTLCLGATADEFEDIAVSSGFGKSLTKTLIHEDGYQVRFYLLDKLGQLQNRIFTRNDCKK